MTMTSSPAVASSMASLSDGDAEEEGTRCREKKIAGEGHGNVTASATAVAAGKSTGAKTTARTRLCADPITDITAAANAADSSSSATTTTTTAHARAQAEANRGPPTGKATATTTPAMAPMTAATTKIPSPRSNLPLTASRASNSNNNNNSAGHLFPFQRSGSLRVRGTKSNLLLRALSGASSSSGGGGSGNELESGRTKATNGSDNNNATRKRGSAGRLALSSDGVDCALQGENKTAPTPTATTTTTTPPTRRRAATRAAAMKQHEQRQQQAAAAHAESSPLRSFSPRRKLLLNNSQFGLQRVQQQQQQPEHQAIQLLADNRYGLLFKRSQSLRRNYKVPSEHQHQHHHHQQHLHHHVSANRTEPHARQTKFCSAAAHGGNVDTAGCQLPNGGCSVGRAHNGGDRLDCAAGPAKTCNGVGNAAAGATSSSLVARIDAELANHANEKMPNGTSPPAAASTPTTAAAPPPQRPATLATNGGAAAAAGVAPTTPTAARTPSTPGSGGHRTRPPPGAASNGQRRVVLTPRTPPVTPDTPSYLLNGLCDEDEDIDSMYSFATTTSGRSTMSCEHPYVARNGTTFSGRKMKYVVHCSAYAGQVGADYLTPTQRAARQIRRLKELLYAARLELEQKDTEMLRLTREVVELRLFKASLSSPEERSASSDGAVTVREAELKTSQDVSPIGDDEAGGCVGGSTGAVAASALGKSGSPRHAVLAGLPTHVMQLSAEMQHSYADSGHFEDMTTSSMHSKDSYEGGGAHSPMTSDTHDIACGTDEAAGMAGVPCGAGDERDGSSDTAAAYEAQRQALIQLYEQRIEELLRTHDAATSDLRRTHNDKVEALLQKLAECNTRYADIVPDYEHAKERIRELERQLEELQRRLGEHEDKQNKMYLHMYQQGQEAERMSRADQALELAHRASTSKVSINELLQQLQSTQDELENIRAAECRMNECGGNHALLTAKEAISLWVLGARKTIYRRLLEAQKNRTHVDPEITLQFLKSAIYYFLTDKENSQGHLQAIESILEFTEKEKQSICKARAAK